MSGFLSSKYLKYLQASSGERIEEDIRCVDCGYNLRGLNYGRACPECGVTIEAPGGAGGASADGLLAGGPLARGDYEQVDPPRLRRLQKRERRADVEGFVL